MSDGRDLIEVAEYYTNLGIIVHQVHGPQENVKNAGKAPESNDWNTATTPLKKPNRAFYRSQGKNIGFLCGRYSDLLVIDIDRKVKGFLEALFHDIDTSNFVKVSHTDDRWHWLFRYNKDLPAGTYKLFGFDILSDFEKDGTVKGNNCIAPPSIHPDGTQYAFKQGSIENRPVMSDKVVTRFLLLIKNYNEIMAVSQKCRKWLRNAIDAIYIRKDHPLYNDLSIFRGSMEARKRSLAIIAEFKANGLSDDGLMCLCAVMFGDTFDKDQSAKELTHVEAKPATYESLRADAYFGQFVPTEEERNTSKKSLSKTSSKKVVEPEVSVYFDEVAEVILGQYDIFTMEDTKEIFIYADGVYKTEGADTFIKAKTKEIYSELYIMKYAGFGMNLPPHIPTAGIKTCNEVLDHIRVLTAVKRKDIDENEEYKWLLNLKNGILNYKTGEFIPHSPEFRITRQLPITYDENATCPNIVKFLSDTLDPADVEVILEFIGYCLVPDTRFPQSIILQGEGSNGKSVLMALIKQFFGEDNLSAIEMQQLCDDRFAAAQLYGKLVNVYPDMSGREITDTGKYKAVSAGDMIEAQRKYGQPFKFRNYSRQIYSVNTVPYTRDQTFSFFRRMILILFPWTFVADPDPEKGQKQADTDLQAKITTEQEMSGLLNLAICCGKHLFEQGKYSYASSVEEVAESYMLKADPVGAFVTVYTEVSDIPMSKTELYEAYVRWSKFKKVPVIGEVKFSKRLKKMGIEDVRPWAPEGEARPRLWDGIKLTDTFDRDVPAEPEKYQRSLSEYPVKVEMKNNNFWQQIVQVQA